MVTLEWLSWGIYIFFFFFFVSDLLFGSSLTDGILGLDIGHGLDTGYIRCQPITAMTTAQETPYRFSCSFFALC